jgi:YVTN family beta-propeller protein
MFLKSVLLAALLPLAAISVQAQSVLATFTYPEGVAGVAVDYIANRAYVAVPQFNGVNDVVEVIDAGSNTVLKDLSVPPMATTIAVNVVSGTVYIGGCATSSTSPTGLQCSVLALNPSTGAVRATIPVTSTSGRGIVAIAVDPLTDKLFVSDASDNAIVVLNGHTNTLVASITLAGQTPAGIAVNFLTGYAYAALNNNQIAVLAPNYSVTYAAYGSKTSGIAVDPFLNREYVTDQVYSAGTVGVLNRKGATKASVSVGRAPLGVDVDFLSSYIFAANKSSGTVSKIDAFSDTVLSTTVVPAKTLAVDPQSSTVFVAGPTTVTVLSEN